MNKRYVRVSFTELKALANADLDFHTLQALFLNELFLPGKGDLTPRDVSAFKVEAESDGVALDVKKGKRFTYQFLTQAPEALLKESCIGLSGTPYLLRWKYDAFGYASVFRGRQETGEGFVCFVPPVYEYELGNTYGGLQ